MDYHPDNLCSNGGCKSKWKCCINTPKGMRHFCHDCTDYFLHIRSYIERTTKFMLSVHEETLAVQPIALAKQALI